MKKKYILGICIIVCLVSVKSMADELKHIYANIVTYSVKVDGEPVILENELLMVDGVTYLPIRELSNVLNYTVSWDAEQEDIQIIKDYQYSDMPIMFMDENSGKYGYKDQNGNVVIEAKFTDASEFSEGAAMGLLDNNIIFFNEQGEYMAEYDNNYHKVSFLEGFSEGCCALHVFEHNRFNTSENFGTIIYVDAMGNQVINKTFNEYGKNFHEGYAVVLRYGGYFMPEPPKFAYIDKTGNFVNDNCYLEAGSFFEGYARVTNESGQCGKIDKSFNFYPDKD